MVIKKIFGKYFPKQDRIIISLLTSKEKEFRLLLTRRIVIHILGKLDAYIKEYVSKKDIRFLDEAVEGFRQEAALNQSQMKPRINKTEALVYEDPSVLLVTGFSLKLKEEKKLTQPLIMGFVLDNKKMLSLPINTHFLRVFKGLLIDLQGKALWGIVKDKQNQDDIATPKRTSVLH